MEERGYLGAPKKKKLKLLNIPTGSLLSKKKKPGKITHITGASKEEATADDLKSERKMYHQPQTKKRTKELLEGKRLDNAKKESEYLKRMMKMLDK